MAIAHLPQTAHVAVIGHHTLPFVVALLRRGCEGVRSLRPGSPAPDCEPVDLAWIVDLQDERELDEALRAARWRAGKRGRVVLEGAACAWRRPPCAPRPGGRPRHRLVRPRGAPAGAGARAASSQRWPRCAPGA